MRKLRFGLALSALMVFAGGASAAEVKFADVVEISGGGAVVGSNWKNAIDPGGRRRSTPRAGCSAQKIEVTHYDTQTNPGVARAQVQKALDGDPYVLFGPVYSGSRS